MLALQLAALGVAVAYAGPPVGDWVARQHAAHQAKRVWLGKADLEPGLEPAFWLTIPDVGIDTLVVSGGDEETLKLYPMEVEPGVVSAHRDLHFRRLKDLEEGASIELATKSAARNLIVTQIEIVDAYALPATIEAGRGGGRVALTTCYPFYYVGPAPQRFVAWAEER